MTALKNASNFVSSVLSQQELNRLKYQNPEGDDEKLPLEWGIIAAEHMGHLLGALRKGDAAAIENEIMHIAGPLLECWNKVKTMQKQTDTYRCTSCQQEFSLPEAPGSCPLCESKIKKVS